MKIKKQKYILSIFIVLSVFIMAGKGLHAETNIPPTVDAGIDITISINDVDTTTLYGSVTDPDNTGFLKCAWENNLQQLTPLMDVIGASGTCPVALSSLNDPGAGTYTLILYGLDGSVVAADSMILALIDDNNGPTANAGPDITITTDQVDTTILQGTVINPYNDDPLRCAWYEDGIVSLTAIVDVGPDGECPLDLSAAIYSDFVIGSYTLNLYGLDDSVLYSDEMVLTIIPPINNPATVEAGSDLIITADEIATTTIYGSVTDPDNTGTLLCAWQDQDINQLTPIMVVVNSTCPLELINALNMSFEVGEYTLTLYGLDGSFISSDYMTLTIVEPNIAPVADAGFNVSIMTEAVNTTIIQGLASDADGDPLTCLWTDGLNALLDISIGTSGVCNLDLSTVPLDIGTYSLFLEISDGDKTSVDEMILSIENTAPHSAPGGGGVYAVGTDVTLVGDVSDYDGDILVYQWIEDATAFCSGNVQTVAEGTPVMVPDCIASNLSLGTHIITLRADDGLNAPDSNSVSVEVVDTTVPTLEPVANYYLLWPPNHVMVDIVIEANASDNSGLLPTLSATVASNEPIDGLGDGDMSPDWTALSIDQTSGTISLQLRRERSGSGNGRVYTVTITATDNSGNSSSTAIDIIVPHDKSKKK
jgi:hypothetical protein